MGESAPSASASSASSSPSSFVGLNVVGCHADWLGTNTQCFFFFFLSFILSSSSSSFFFFFFSSSSSFFLPSFLPTLLPLLLFLLLLSFFLSSSGSQRTLDYDLVPTVSVALLLIAAPTGYACGGSYVIRSHPIVFSSPNYGSAPYPRNIKCFWSFTSSDRKVNE